MKKTNSKTYKILIIIFVLLSILGGFYIGYLNEDMTISIYVAFAGIIILVFGFLICDILSNLEEIAKNSKK